MRKTKRPTDFAVLQIRMMLKVGFTIDEIAAYFGVIESEIKQIIKSYEFHR